MEQYWNMNQRQFEKYINVFNRKNEEELTRADTLNHALGQYIAIAFHNPKEYPEKPFSCKESKVEVMSDDDMERRAMEITMALGGKINGNNT